jgi:hypothetical protein
MNNWSEWSCDRTTGQKTRTRTTIQPELNGGICGPTKEDAQSCERDCTMNNWTEWSCDRTTGQKTRTRTTIQPELNGGICGPTKDTQSCERDCTMNNWSEWSCDRTTGQKTRTRTTIQPELNGGICGPTKEDTQNCERDCTMNNWTEWSCDRTTGQKTRTRATIQPELNGGVTCGPTKDTQSCERDCTMNNWTEWSCDRTTGKKTRTRTTIQPELNGGICGPTKDTQSCERDCTMNNWTEWSCDRTTGKKTRTRTTIQPELNGGICGPTKEDAQNCERDCTMNNWTEWSCDRTIGQKTRTRATIQPELNGGICGPTKDTQSCERDCTMNNWSEWSCDRTTGQKTRTRTTIQPELNGGICGPTKDTENCERDCTMNNWTEWSCDRTTGQKTRTRATIQPELNGGICGPTKDTGNCERDCKFGDWSDWWCDRETERMKRLRIITENESNGGSCTSNTEELGESCNVHCDADIKSYDEFCTKIDGKYYRMPKEIDINRDPSKSNSCIPSCYIKQNENSSQIFVNILYQKIAKRNNDAELPFNNKFLDIISYVTSGDSKYHIVNMRYKFNNNYLLSGDILFQDENVIGLGYLYMSNNYGKSFFKIKSLGLGVWDSVCISNNGMYCLCVCFRDELRYEIRNQYQTTLKKGIYISKDYGITWNKMPVNVDVNGYKTDLSSYLHLDYAETIKINQTRIRNIVCVSGDGKYQVIFLMGYLCISNDYGVTWIEKSYNGGVGGIFTPETIPYITQLGISKNGQYITIFINNVKLNKNNDNQNPFYNKNDFMSCVVFSNDYGNTFNVGFSSDHGSFKFSSSGNGYRETRLMTENIIITKIIVLDNGTSIFKADENIKEYLYSLRNTDPIIYGGFTGLADFKRASVQPMYWRDIFVFEDMTRDSPPYSNILLGTTYEDDPKLITSKGVIKVLNTHLFQDMSRHNNDQSGYISHKNYKGRYKFISAGWNNKNLKITIISDEKEKLSIYDFDSSFNHYAFETLCSGRYTNDNWRLGFICDPLFSNHYNDSLSQAVCNNFYKGPNCKYFNNKVFFSCYFYDNIFTNIFVFKFKDDGFYNFYYYDKNASINIESIMTLLKSTKEEENSYYSSFFLKNGAYYYNKSTNSIVLENFGDKYLHNENLYIYEIVKNDDKVLSFKFSFFEKTNLNTVVIEYENLLTRPVYRDGFIYQNKMYDKLSYFNWYKQKTGFSPFNGTLSTGLPYYFNPNLNFNHDSIIENQIINDNIQPFTTYLNIKPFENYMINKGTNLYTIKNKLFVGLNSSKINFFRFKENGIFNFYSYSSYYSPIKDILKIEYSSNTKDLFYLKNGRYIYNDSTSTGQITMYNRNFYTKDSNHIKIVDTGEIKWPQYNIFDIYNVTKDSLGNGINSFYLKIGNNSNMLVNGIKFIIVDNVYDISNIPDYFIINNIEYGKGLEGYFRYLFV